MRTGGCTVQQALTAEAATVVKQAVTLATRRGHAQVTPLHVANTMLSSASGLLRTACLQSNSHPLQCKALELCFNVALNRLPASTSAPILGGGGGSHQCPSISNALVAAFKRAQAHQRRGSIENQQQPLLAVKIEVEQLIISILDDPSVSRVMREAGFSSTQVKSNVEQAVSLEICSNSQTAPNSKTKETSSNNVLTLSQSTPPKSFNHHQVSSSSEEDVMSVVDCLMDKRRRSFAIVGECVSTIEGVVKGVMDKFQKGEVPELLRETKFITLQVSSYLTRLEIEQKIQEVKEAVRNQTRKGGGVVLNVGDLKWAVERGSSSLDPVEMMIMEIGKVRENYSNNGKFWIMGMATFQTYMKCKTAGNPSLETVWGLHPLTVPAGSLRLSLITDSDAESECRSKKMDEKGSNWINRVEEKKQLNCCSDCSAKFEAEARSIQSSACNTPDSATSTLPAWLRRCNTSPLITTTNYAQEDNYVSMKDLCKKWNSFCNSIHHHHQQQPYSSEKISSLSPSSSTSIFSYDHCPNSHQQSWREHHFWSIASENKDTDHQQPSLQLCTPNSTSSSDVVMELEYLHKFKELNSENLKTLCNALEKRVPWQKHIIPEIATTVLQCRSGMVRRKVNLISGDHESKEETWFFFQGIDMEAKDKVARELARVVFGHQNDFVSISLSSFSSTRADSTEDCRNKRSRDEQSCSYLERFADAVSGNPHRVFFVEDVEQADYCSQIGFKRGIERGRITKRNGEEIGLGDAIIILSSESFSSRSRACSPPVKQKMDEEMEEETVSPNSAPLDLNISIDDDSLEDDHSIDDIGILESVDRRIVFKIQEL